MTQYILSLSYGKDSLACLGAIEQLGLPLDRIVHAEVWATDEIQADLPPMVEFKKKADAIIKERYGIEVEHICAMDKNGDKRTYEKIFYTTPKRQTVGKFKKDDYKGFPYTIGAWCNSRLKVDALTAVANTFSKKIDTVVQYIGIAADEPERLDRLDCVTKISPLALIGWNESDARKWCEENDLLSPIYTTATRGGCWFCHNQSVDQMRLLYKNYPEYWNILLKWDSDSPVSFKPDGHTVHDYDLRFYLEDLDIISSEKRFRWSFLKDEDFLSDRCSKLNIDLDTIRNNYINRLKPDDVV